MLVRHQQSVGVWGVRAAGDGRLPDPRQHRHGALGVGEAVGAAWPAGGGADDDPGRQRLISGWLCVALLQRPGRAAHDAAHELDLHRDELVGQFQGRVEDGFSQ